MITEKSGKMHVVKHTNNPSSRKKAKEIVKIHNEHCVVYMI